MSSRSSTSRSLTTPQYLEALQRETRLAAGLDHPNITTVYDFQVEDVTAYIVMEYVPDARGSRRIPWQRVAEIALQITRVLQHAHDKGAVHQDIKPQNVLLREDGSVAVSDCWQHSPTSTDLIIRAVA